MRTTEIRHLKFISKNRTVYIDFNLEFYPGPHIWNDRRVTYCTISVYDKDGAVKHYHGATMYNPHDNYNKRTGMFVAFKNALHDRWYDMVDDYGNPSWKDYHKAWAHFLAAMMDGKVENGIDTSAI